MFEKFGLTSKCYVKEEGINFTNMATTLKSIISCEASSLPIPFYCVYFKHAMNKVVQYVTNIDKISKNLALINVKSTQTSSQYRSTWPKKLIMFYVNNPGFCNANMIVSYEMYNKINPSFFILHCRQGGKRMEVNMSKIWFA